MITAVQEKDLYIIRFPYDTEVIRLIKNVPGWRWINDKKYWTIPVARLGFLIVQFQGTPYEHQLEVYSDERIDENATLDDTAAIPDIDISDVTYQVEDGLFPLPHQLDFMRYSIYRQHQGLHSGFILADQPGLAKTNQTMNLALYNRQFNHIKHCLVIVCQNSAKYNWIEDIRKHTNGLEVPYLLGQRRKRNGDIRMEGSSLEKLEDLKCGHMYGDPEAPELPFFIVMNIEAIRMISNRHYWIREQLTQLVNSGYIGMIAIDECHKNCLDYDTQIHTDLGLLKIGDIVKYKLPVCVLTYNELNGHHEWQPVIDWVENTVNTSLVELLIDTPNGPKKIRCTPDHKFYTKNRGWVCAKDLQEYDDIDCI